jgi:hypothetical protein
MGNILGLGDFGFGGIVSKTRNFRLKKGFRLFFLRTEFKLLM